MLFNPERYTQSNVIIQQDDMYVYRAYDSVGKRNVIVTQMKLIYADTNEYQIKKQHLQDLTKKLERISKFQHKNIAKIYQVIKESDNTVYFISEYCEYGSAIDYIKAEKFIDQRLAIFTIREVASGLDFLHENGIEHGFINLQNIELDGGGNWKLSFKCLTLKAFYLSPEFKIEKTRGKEGDIFSLGISLHKLLFGVFPYSGKTNEEIIEKTKNNDRRKETAVSDLLPIQICVSKKTQNLVLQMIKYDSRARPSCKTILNDIDIKLYEEKFDKMLLQIKQRYLVFRMFDKIEHEGYYSEYLFDGINKLSRQLVKIKCVDISSVNEQKLREYKKKIKLFSQIHLEPDPLNISLIKIKQAIFNNQMIVVYEYFNQWTLKEYFQNRKALLKAQVFQEQVVKDIAFYLYAAVKRYDQVCGAHGWIFNSNICLKQGRLKIREPMFEDQKMEKIIKSKKDFIDFMCPEKKKNKVTIKEQIDYWSLGANIYMLLQNRFPKFDSSNTLVFSLSNNVHKELKDNLSYCFNPFKESTVTLNFINPPIPNVAKYYDITKQEAKRLVELLKPKPKKKQIHKPIPVYKPVVYKQVEQQQCLQKLCTSVVECCSLSDIQYFQTLDGHSTKKYRYFMKSIVSIILYFSLFYYAFLARAGTLSTTASSYTNLTLSLRTTSTDVLPNVNLTIVTNNIQYYSGYYNQTLSNIGDCAKDNYSSNKSSTSVYLNSYIKSASFKAYQIIGMCLVFFHLIFKCLQVYYFDIPKLVSSVGKDQESKINSILSLTFIELSLSCLFSLHYVVYGALYHLDLQPCLSNPQQPSVDVLFSGLNGNFVLTYIWMYMGMVISYTVIIAFCIFVKPSSVQNYVWIILIFVYIAGLGCRALNSLITNKGTNSTMVSFYGLCGQMLELVTVVACGLIDWVFWKIINRINDNRRKRIDRIIEINESNHTFHTES